MRNIRSSSASGRVQARALPDTVVQGWARAADQAKSFDTANVRAELEKFTDEPLLAGLTTFTPKLHTNLNRPMLMIEIKDTKPSPLGYYDMRKGDYVKWW
jgi:branched-chain amino acid transport system substrate-binding protein